MSNGHKTQIATNKKEQKQNKAQPWPILFTNNNGYYFIDGFIDGAKKHPAKSGPRPRYYCAAMELPCSCVFPHSFRDRPSLRLLRMPHQ